MAKKTASATSGSRSIGYVPSLRALRAARNHRMKDPVRRYKTLVALKRH
ncbi:MAG TPA: hypothetical protein VG144_10845 [Gaiellaceae bacterium]|nr:hypothetical protein [Gaiellaceae bacterium]